MRMSVARFTPIQTKAEHQVSLLAVRCGSATRTLTGPRALVALTDRRRYATALVNPRISSRVAGCISIEHEHCAGAGPGRERNGQGRRGRGQGLPHDCGLRPAESGDVDLCTVERRERQRQSPRRGLGRVRDRHHAAGCFPERRVTWKQRADVPVGSDAQQHDVEPWRIAEDADEIGFGTPSPRRRDPRHQPAFCARVPGRSPHAPTAVRWPVDSWTPGGPAEQRAHRRRTRPPGPNRLPPRQRRAGTLVPRTRLAGRATRRGRPSVRGEPRTQADRRTHARARQGQQRLFRQARAAIYYSRPTKRPAEL